MNPIVLSVIGLCGILILGLPRRTAIVPLLCRLFLVPLSEVLEVGPLHFNSVRFLLLLSFIRLLIRGECRLKRRSVLDFLVLAHIAVSATAYVLLRFDGAALVNRLGVSYELILAFIVIRVLVQDIETLETALATIVAVCAIIAVGMAIEYATQRVVFASIVGAADIPAIRNGRIRCQGPFQHAIIAGVFGATCLPLCLSLLWTKRRRHLVAGIGATSAAIIVWASGSSTPAMCLFGAMLGLFAWHIRKYMTIIRWLTVGALFFAHIAMNDPVWALVARGRVFGGSTGYYRYMLIDLFIRHFTDWWLLGTDSYISWSRAYGMGLWDACDMYVRQGIDGGLLTLLLFFAVIVFAFKLVGRQVRQPSRSGPKALMVWAFGVAVFAHAVGFIGVNYFDGQISSAWYMLLAIIAGLSGMRQRKPAAMNVTGSTGVATRLPSLMNGPEDPIAEPSSR